MRYSISRRRFPFREATTLVFVFIGYQILHSGSTTENYGDRGRELASLRDKSSQRCDRIFSSSDFERLMLGGNDDLLPIVPGRFRTILYVTLLVLMCHKCSMTA